MPFLGSIALFVLVAPYLDVLARAGFAVILLRSHGAIDQLRSLAGKSEGTEVTFDPAD